MSLFVAELWLSLWTSLQLINLMNLLKWNSLEQFARDTDFSSLTGFIWQICGMDFLEFRIDVLPVAFNPVHVLTESILVHFPASNAQ